MSILACIVITTYPEAGVDEPPVVKHTEFMFNGYPVSDEKGVALLKTFDLTHAHYEEHSSCSGTYKHRLTAGGAYKQRMAVTNAPVEWVKSLKVGSLVRIVWEGEGAGFSHVGRVQPSKYSCRITVYNEGTMLTSSNYGLNGVSVEGSSSLIPLEEKP